MKLGKISATIALLTMFIGTAGQAQSRQRHDGFWIGFGIGGGVNASANNDERGGGALSLRLGGTLSQKFLLGGEISAWGRQEDSELGGDPLTVTKSNATFMVMFFPSDAGGFFIKGASNPRKRSSLMAGCISSVGEGIPTDCFFFFTCLLSSSSLSPDV